MLLGFLTSVACSEGKQMNHLDPRKYFPDSKVAAFVDDVQHGNVERVSLALKGGMDPNSTGKDGPSS